MASHREAGRQGRTITAADLRAMAISEFGHWLRGRTNKHKRPYQEKTISDYTEAVETLSQWMARREIEEDFPAFGPEMLKTFFAEYLEANTQGGTNTRQRNLHHFFKWLEKTAGCPDPWKSENLVRYGPGKKRPSTLAMEYIKDLLAVTGGGNARNFDYARDHAIFRMLGEGVRRTELEQQQLRDLPSDLIARPFTRVVPLKGAREFEEGRLVAMAPSTARAVVAYLRFRQSHRHAELPSLWLGRKGALTGSGVARMIDRRSDQLGGIRPTSTSGGTLSPTTCSTGASRKATRCGSWAGRTGPWSTGTPRTSKSSVRSRSSSAAATSTEPHPVTRSLAVARARAIHVARAERPGRERFLNENGSSERRVRPSWRRAC